MIRSGHQDTLFPAGHYDHLNGSDDEPLRVAHHLRVGRNDSLDNVTSADAERLPTPSRRLDEHLSFVQMAPPQQSGRRRQSNRSRPTAWGRRPLEVILEEQDGSEAA